MTPRIEEQLAAMTATPPVSPLLTSVPVLVGNCEGPTVPFLSIGKASDENMRTSISINKEQLSWTIHAASQLRLQLLHAIQNSGTRTLLLEACLVSLQETAHTLIEHASRLVETMDHETSPRTSSYLASTSSVATTNMSMGRIRASFAVKWALRYLDSIRTAMTKQDSDHIDLNNKLQHLLDQKNHTKHPFRLSPWALSSSQLVLDMKVGDTATWSDADHEILSLAVDPMWRVKANDLQGASNTSNNMICSVAACTVTILKVTHRGNGEALVRLGVAPLSSSLTGGNTNNNDKQNMTPKKKKEKIVWSKDHHANVAFRKKFRVQEARVIQLNADPPTPTTNVDLYESIMYGDVATTVTILIKTYPTCHNEVPNLHMELIVALE